MINVQGKTEGSMRACYGDAAQSGKEAVEQLSFKQKSEGGQKELRREQVEGILLKLLKVGSFSRCQRFYIYLLREMERE